MTAFSTRARTVPGRWLAVPAVAGAIVGLYALGTHLATDPLGDVRAYYNAAARLNAGLPLYPVGANSTVSDFYRYPPLLAILFRPLALLPFASAAAVWEILMVSAFILTLRQLGLGRPSTWVTAGVLGIAIGWALAIGQAEVIVTLLLTVGSPLSVALAGNLKLLPLLAGVFWLARRDWQSLGRLTGWTVGLGLLQLVLEPANSLAYPSVAVGNVGQVRSFGNVSPFVLSPALWAALVVVGLAVTLLLGRTRWGWSAAVALAVLASPRLFLYQLMTLLACLRRLGEDLPD